MAKGQFQKKAVQADVTAMGLDPEKVYEFELIQTYEKYKGTDETGAPVGLPYPASVGIPNNGIAYDEVKKEKRRWRFLDGVPTIWVDEQEIEPTPLELADERNQLEFIQGRIRVRGMDQNKLAALMVNDLFEGKKIQAKPVQPLYRLLNPDEAISASLEAMDVAFEAESTARGASEEDMMAYAIAQNMNVTNGLNALKKDFIMQAKANPVHFLKHFVNPRNKYLMIFTQALANNEISASTLPNQLIWSGNQTVITEVNSAGDVASELADRAIKGEEAIELLFEQLEKLS